MAQLRALLLSYAELARFPQTSLRATLDCTGGWYSAQTWRGVSAGVLLDQAGVLPSARFVSFVSVTGYRWSLPIAEACAALLATHVGNELLNHWHGAPLRLVAPGRRGFMWVKWVREVVVLTQPDLGQWIAIFISGPDATRLRAPPFHLGPRLRQRRDRQLKGQAETRQNLQALAFLARK